MSKEIDLKEIEKKALRSVHEDGFMAIEFGIMIIGLGLPGFPEEWLPRPWNYMLLYILMVAVAMTVYILGKKYLTAPRVGLVRLSVKQSPTQRKIMIFLSVNVLFSIVVLIFTMLGMFHLIPISGFMVMLLFGFIAFTLPISVLAYFIGVNHMYVVAFVGGLSFFFTELLRLALDGPVSGIIGFGISGCAILLVGLMALAKFVRKYPLVQSEKISEPEE